MAPWVRAGHNRTYILLTAMTTDPDLRHPRDSGRLPHDVTLVNGRNSLTASRHEYIVLLPFSLLRDRGLTASLRE